MVWVCVRTEATIVTVTDRIGVLEFRTSDLLTAILNAGGVPPPVRGPAPLGVPKQQLEASLGTRKRRRAPMPSNYCSTSEPLMVVRTACTPVLRDLNAGKPDPCIPNPLSPNDSSHILFPTLLLEPWVLARQWPSAWPWRRRCSPHLFVLRLVPGQSGPTVADSLSSSLVWL